MSLIDQRFLLKTSSIRRNHLLGKSTTKEKRRYGVGTGGSDETGMMPYW